MTDSIHGTNPRGRRILTNGRARRRHSDTPVLERRTPATDFMRWDPRPLAPPETSEVLDSENPVVRSAEVCRYSAGRAEYAVSSDGVLREWARLVLRQTLALLILAAPLAVLMLLAGMVVPVVKSALLLAGVVLVLRFLWQLNRRNRERESVRSEEQTRSPAQDNLL